MEFTVTFLIVENGTLKILNSIKNYLYIKAFYLPCSLDVGFILPFILKTYLLR